MKLNRTFATTLVKQKNVWIRNGNNISVSLRKLSMGNIKRENCIFMSIIIRYFVINHYPGARVAKFNGRVFEKFFDMWMIN